MIAVDTNVLIRLLTGDEISQATAARSLFISESVWIAKTVLLETDWVLRSLYGYDDSAVRDAFASVLGLENVQAEDEASVAETLALGEHGMQFADAIHLSSRPAGAAFVSFDKTLIRRVRRAGVRGVSPVSM
jgi:predicted nucleic-acid-binding protein